jgi:hypothetical protein
VLALGDAPPTPPHPPNPQRLAELEAALDRLLQPDAPVSSADGWPAASQPSALEAARPAAMATAAANAALVGGGGFGDVDGYYPCLAAPAPVPAAPWADAAASPVRTRPPVYVRVADGPAAAEPLAVTPIPPPRASPAAEPEELQPAPLAPPAGLTFAPWDEDAKAVAGGGAAGTVVVAAAAKGGGEGAVSDVQVGALWALPVAEAGGAAVLHGGAAARGGRCAALSGVCGGEGGTTVRGGCTLLCCFSHLPCPPARNLPKVPAGTAVRH